jgi:hypothetical protein
MCDDFEFLFSRNKFCLLLFSKRAQLLSASQVASCLAYVARRLRCLSLYRASCQRILPHNRMQLRAGRTEHHVTFPDHGVAGEAEVHSKAAIRRFPNTVGLMIALLLICGLILYGSSSGPMRVAARASENTLTPTQQQRWRQREQTLHEIEPTRERTEPNQASFHGSSRVQSSSSNSTSSTTTTTPLHHPDLPTRDPAGHYIRMPPGTILTQAAVLAAPRGDRAVKLVGSQLCAYDLRSGVLAVHDCWGEQRGPTGQHANVTSSFLSHQTDGNLCAYWGTPEVNVGAAWCEFVPACSPPSGQVSLFLDDDGRLVGTCGGRRVWPTVWPTPALVTTEHAPPHLAFRGIAHKGVNGPILSTQRALHNRQDAEYRVTSFEWHLDYSKLREGERVESDICLTIFSSGKETSLESGEELLCTHEQVVRSAGSLIPGNTSNALPLGGFPLRRGKRVNVAGVSNIFPIVEDYRPRLADDPEFLSLHFVVQLERVDTMDTARAQTPLSSVRSPRRDRSYTASIARHVAPKTDFRNVGSTPVLLRGVGTFASAIQFRRRIDIVLRVLVDGQQVVQEPLPSQLPDRSLGSATKVVPIDVTLRPSQVVSVQMHVLANASSIFDAASFLLSDAREGALVPATEMQLWPTRLDLNGDGAIDNVDYDGETGEIWAELTRVHCKGCPGAHDTQFRWGNGLPWTLSAFSRSATFIGAMDGGRRPLLSVTDPATRQCLELVRHSKDSNIPFKTRACGDTTRRGPSRPGADFEYYADFDGDGLVDRLAVSKRARHSAKYGLTWLTPGASSKRGNLELGKESIWLPLAAPFDHHMLEFDRTSGRGMLITEACMPAGACKHNKAFSSTNWPVFGNTRVYMECPCSSRLGSTCVCHNRNRSLGRSLPSWTPRNETHKQTTHFVLKSVSNRSR